MNTKPIPLKRLACLAQHDSHLVEWQAWSYGRGKTGPLNTWACLHCGTKFSSGGPPDETVEPITFGERLSDGRVQFIFSEWWVIDD